MPRGVYIRTPKMCANMSKSHIGKHPSEETRNKMSKSQTGKRLSEETRKKISKSQTGLQVGEKHPMFGKHFSEEICKKLSVLRRNNPNYKGKRHTKESRKKISGALTGIIESEETCRKLSEFQTGEKNHNWRGGISFEPYCPLFNFEFKERVRAFFEYTCKLCGHVWQQGERRLSVHHVNYDKMVCCDNVSPLFVPICSKCHPRTNNNREYWEDIFTNMIMLEHDGECYIKVQDDNIPTKRRKFPNTKTTQEASAEA